MEFEAYRRAEARAFVAHHRGFRVDQVDELTLVSIGVEVPPAQLEAIARSMDERAAAVQKAEAIAA